MRWWLAGIVVVSAAIRIALGRHVIAPWIMVDELIYSELAKSFAASGHFQIRGVASNGYGFVYPALIAPAWKLFGPMPTVYAAAKVINAVLMSLAAIPAYLLARRLLTPGLALCAAVLTIAIPQMLYTSELMTENIFFPLFLVVVWALVATLELPTWRRQVGVLVLCGLAFATRQQAVALIPAVSVAPALHGWIERDLRRALRAWLPTYAILGAGIVLALGGTVARGRSPLTLLGAYRAATSVPYSVSSVLHYVLWHVAELDLAVGIVPLVALLALWIAPRAASPGARAFAAATLPVTVLVVVEVAIFASTQSERIEERNMFYVMPFALIALLGFAEREAIERRRWAIVAAALAAGALPAAIPLARFINDTALSDTFGLLPVWWVQDRGIDFTTLRWVIPLVGLVVAAAVVVVPRRYAMVLVGLVAVYFVLSGAIVQNGRHGIVRASRGALFAGIHNPHYDWVDRAVGRDAHVTTLWNGVGLIQQVWDNEFFNRSVKGYVDTGNVFTGGLPESTLSARSDGALVDAQGRPERAAYALAPQSSFIAGSTIATDPGTGMLLVRVDGPLVVLVRVTGLYPTDTWSGRHVLYFRRRCTGGSVSVQLQSDPQLFAGTTQVVSANGHSITLQPTSNVITFLVPLAVHPNHTCTANFTVAKLRVPAQVEGSTDKRALGVHFLHLFYLP
ncbi:MAG TPA: glycosyltransferase family 39 protein [Gaiellaceae bacterium]|nr:glycosyltransferase family 39 protein [Gaiellaceae bacterium]